MFGLIKLKNFRCFEDETINLKNRKGSLKPQTFIYGENMSGKTSFLLSIAFLKELTEGLTTNNIMYDRNLKDAHNTAHFFDLKHLIANNRRKRAEGSMVLYYELAVEKSMYSYELVFENDTTLSKELLRKKVNNQWITVYEASEDAFQFGRSMILQKDLKKIQTFFNHYFGRYSMLSILYYLQFEQESINVKQTLANFIWYVVNIYIDLDGRYHSLDYNNFKFETNIGVLKGVADQFIKDILEMATPVFNTIATNIYPHFDSITYFYEPLPNKRWAYRVKVYMKTQHGPTLVSHENVPQGLKRLMELMPIFINYYSERTVILDNLDAALHGETLRYFLQVLLPHLPGQILAVMSGNDAMNMVDPSSVFIASYQDFTFSIQGIDHMGANQPNHNIRTRYEQGAYGEFIKMEEKSVMTLVLELNTKMREYFKSRL